MKTHLISLQYAIFFKDIIERPDIEFSSLNSDMLNLFDSMPSIIPVPRELPDDIPVITLKNEKGDYKCNIARSRIDLHYNRIEGDTPNSEILKGFNLKVNAFVKSILEKQDVIRFGMVCKYFIEDDKATETLKEKYFCNTIKDPTELSLRYNNTSEFEKIELNDIVEIGKATIKLGEELKKGISIQRDINNVPTSKTLNYEELKRISVHFSKMISEHGVEALIK